MEKPNYVVELVKGVSKKGNEYHSIVVSVVVNGVKLEVTRGFVNNSSLAVLSLAGITL